VCVCVCVHVRTDVIPVNLTIGVPRPGPYRQRHGQGRGSGGSPSHPSLFGARHVPTGRLRVPDCLPVCLSACKSVCLSGSVTVCVHSNVLRSVASHHGCMHACTALLVYTRTHMTHRCMSVFVSMCVWAASRESRTPTALSRLTSTNISSSSGRVWTHQQNRSGIRSHMIVGEPRFFTRACPVTPIGDARCVFLPHGVNLEPLISSTCVETRPTDLMRLVHLGVAKMTGLASTGQTSLALLPCTMVGPVQAGTYPIATRFTASPASLARLHTFIILLAF